MDCPLFGQIAGLARINARLGHIVLNLQEFRSTNSLAELDAGLVTSVAAPRITVQSVQYWSRLISETTQLQNSEPPSATPWRAIYIGVIIFAAVVILSLSLFSQHFSG